MGTTRKGVIFVLLLGVLCTAIFYYLFVSRWSVPKVVRELEGLVNKGYSDETLRDMFKAILLNNDSVVYIRLDNLEKENVFTVEKSSGKVWASGVVEIKVPLDIGGLRVGFKDSMFYKETGGKAILITGLVMTILMLVLFYVLFKGMEEQLGLVASYIKGSDIEDVGTLIEEDWPPEIKKVIVAIDLLLRRVERKLKIRIEEVKRDKLFAHNSIADLVDCLDKVSQGDLSVRAETAPDMVGALGEAFNDALSVLEERLSHAQALVKKLEMEMEREDGNLAQMKELLRRLKMSLQYFKTVDRG